MWRTHSCLLVVGGLGVAVLLAQPSTAWAQAGPNLAIALSHNGNFTVGENGVYTIVVSNIGGMATAINGLIEVSTTDLCCDTTEPGWFCYVIFLRIDFPRRLVCAFTNQIAPGGSAPPLTLTFVPSVSGTVTNTVYLFAQGGTYSTNSSATDVAIVLPAVPTLPEWR
jgi:mucin-19